MTTDRFDLAPGIGAVAPNAAPSATAAAAGARRRPRLDARAPWGWLATIMAGLWIATTIDVVRRWQELAVGDFETYWDGARHLLDGERLYPLAQLSGPFVLGDAAFGRGFVYPPTAAILSAPIAVVPMIVAFAMFALGSAIVLGGVVYAMIRREGVRRQTALLVAAAIALTGPGLDAILTGNINALAAAALGAMWLRPRLSGYLAVLGGLIKVYPAIGLVWAIRRRAPLVGPILIGVAIFVASVVLLGTGPWSDFRQTMANGLSNEYFPIQSPRSLLWAPLGAGLAGAASVALTALVLLIVLRARDDRVAFFALSVAMILPAPEWHLHYFVVPVVGALPLIIRGLRAERDAQGSVSPILS